MSRRRRATKRKPVPDQKYNNVVVSKFINRVMLHGKKYNEMRDSLLILHPDACSV